MKSCEVNLYVTESALGLKIYIGSITQSRQPGEKIGFELSFDGSQDQVGLKLVQFIITADGSKSSFKPNIALSPNRGDSSFASDDRKASIQVNIFDKEDLTLRIHKPTSLSIELSSFDWVSVSPSPCPLDLDIKDTESVLLKNKANVSLKGKQVKNLVFEKTIAQSGELNFDNQPTTTWIDPENFVSVDCSRSFDVVIARGRTEISPDLQVRTQTFICLNQNISATTSNFPKIIPNLLIHKNIDGGWLAEMWMACRRINLGDRQELLPNKILKLYSQCLKRRLTLSPDLHAETNRDLHFDEINSLISHFYDDKYDLVSELPPNSEMLYKIEKSLIAENEFRFASEITLARHITDCQELSLRSWFKWLSIKLNICTSKCQTSMARPFFLSLFLIAVFLSFEGGDRLHGCIAHHDVCYCAGKVYQNLGPYLLRLTRPWIDTTQSKLLAIVLLPIITALLFMVKHAYNRYANYKW